MPSNKWFMTSITQTLTATGYSIVIQTDVACHLWMRWTLVKPKEHLIQRTKRGLPLMLDKYFCFDVYEDNEQEEAGDTLEHTFIKEPWPVCETRYFYFHGEISGIASPSTTPIFEKHRTPPPITVDFYPDAHPEVTSVDGRAGQSGFEYTWAQIRASAGSYSSDISYALVLRIVAGPWTDDTWYTLERSFLLFDTSPIGASAKIQSAKITLYCGDKSDDLNIQPDIVIVTSYPVENTSLVPSDYHRIGFIPLSNVIPYEDFIWHTYIVFTLNAFGLAQINKTGISKFGAREFTHDLLGNIPNYVQGLGSDLNFSASETGLLYSPKLTVTYQP